MPISMDEFRSPSWTKLKDRYPMSYDKKDKFHKFETDSRSFRDGEFKQAGYNPNHDSTRVEKINTETDGITLKGR